MSAETTDQAEKVFDPTPQKLARAREKGDIPRAAELSVAAAYMGLFVGLFAFGSASVQKLGSGLMTFVDRPEKLSETIFADAAHPLFATAFLHIADATLPWFAAPMAFVATCILVQRGFVFTPDKLKPRASRVSILKNAGQKFGRNGWFEFSKSCAKLLLFSICLAIFLRGNLTAMVASAGSDPSIILVQMSNLAIRFLGIAALVATAVGLVDFFWQNFEHRKKNRMTMKELKDETKEAEGDPFLKQKRRQMGQDITRQQLASDVPKADVVIVNPTHYAVALKWERHPGTAPVCIAKGVDETAARIRRIANDHTIPIHSDPPTARAIYSSVSVGDEIDPDFYRAVAAAINFADRIRGQTKV